jgi:hypothetical protein
MHLVPPIVMQKIEKARCGGGEELKEKHTKLDIFNPS